MKWIPWRIRISDDFVDFLADFGLPCLLMVMVTVVAVVSVIAIGTAPAPKPEPSRLDKVCHSLNGKVVEDVCIKDGKVAYRK